MGGTSLPGGHPRGHTNSATLLSTRFARSWPTWRSQEFLGIWFQQLAKGHLLSPPGLRQELPHVLVTLIKLASGKGKSHCCHLQSQSQESRLSLLPTPSWGTEVSSAGLVRTLKDLLPILLL